MVEVFIIFGSLNMRGSSQSKLTSYFTRHALIDTSMIFFSDVGLETS